MLIKLPVSINKLIPRISMRWFLHLFVLLFFGVRAQYDFKVVNQENGLPSSAITSIFQDSRNILWIGTDGAGLVKYQGASYITYDQGDGLEGGFITDICEDNSNNLLIGTRYNGIIFYNGKNFSGNLLDQYKDHKYSDHIYKLLRTGRGVYSVSAAEITLLREDSVEFIVANRHDYKDINGIASTSNGDLYFSGNGLFRLRGKQITRILGGVLKNYACISRSSDGRMFVSGQDGAFYELIINKDGNEELVLQGRVPAGSGFHIKRILSSGNGQFWLAGEINQGLLLVSGHNSIPFNSSNGFSGESVTCLYEDRNGHLLIGTNGTGLYRAGKKMFENHLETDLLNKSHIFSILKDRKSLYIGLKEVGVYEFSEADNGRYQLSRSYLNGTGARVIFKNRDGKIIIGDKYGIAELTGNGLMVAGLDSFNTSKSLVIALEQDRNGNYLIGTHGDGLLLTDSRFRLIKKFCSNSRFTDVSTINGDSGAWYLGTSNGIFKFTRQGKNSYEAQPVFYNKGRIREAIGVATEDSYGNYWFSGNNTLYVITASDSVYRYSKKDGITSTLIYTLIADRNGHIWAGSNLGLDRIEVNGDGRILSIRNYNSKNGFIGLETNMRAQYLDSDGRILLGTAKGLIECLNNSDEGDKRQLKLVITNVKVFNREFNWKSENSKNKWVNVPDSGYRFKSSENHLTFEFMAGNDGMDEEVYFIYKLEGIDKNWSVPTPVKEITYSNLPHGNYTLRIRPVDKMGTSLNDETNFSFSIKTPFYFTWWFFLSVALLLVAFFMLLFKKSETYNQDFVKTYGIRSLKRNEEIRMYLFIFGVAAPLTEIFIELFKVRNNSELAVNFGVGLICIVIYYLSKRNSFIYNHIQLFFTIIVLGFFVAICYKVYFLPFELITFSEFFIALFFSYSLFSTGRQYWIFIFMVCVFLLSLFFNNAISTETVMVYCNFTVFIIFINHSRHVARLNSEEELLFVNSIVNNGNSLVVATNKNLEAVFLSENVKEILGYDKSELMGKGWLEKTVPSVNELESLRSKIRDSQSQGRIYSRKIKTRDGAYKWIQWQDKLFSDNIIVGLGQDITGQVRAQEQYENLIETATDIIYKTDKNGIITFTNQYATGYTGYTISEILGRHFTYFIRKDYIKRVALYYVKNIGLPAYDSLEFPMQMKDGASRWVSQKVTVERDSAGEPIGFFAIIRDINAIKQIEFEKQEIQRQYEGLIESASDIIYKTDPEGNFIFFNKYTEKVLGYKLEELLGKHFTWVIRKDFVRRVALYYVRNRDLVDSYEIQEFPVILKSRKEMWVSQKVTVERDSEGRVLGFNSIVRDITLIKNIEFEKQEKQLKIEKLNQILNELSLKPYSDTEKLKTILESIIERAAEGLKIERISIWNYNTAGIECRHLFEASVKRHSNGGVIDRQMFPLYFKAVETGNAIVASDVSRHHALKEMMAEYLPVLGIRSKLDFPIYQQGQLQGVVCCESVNSFKKWDTEDINFARGIADIISISIEAQRRKKAEKQLAFRSEILAAIAKTTEKLLVSTDISETLGDCLEMIGKATRVDKVYFYENDNSTQLLTLRKQWFSERWPVPKFTPEITVIPVDGLGPISKTLLEKRFFFSIVRELKSEKLKEMLSSQNILSILVIPVFVKDTYYGFIGFDDCTRERVWTGDQLNVIRSLATNIANAIERINNEQVIKENENNFRQINETIEDVFWLYDNRNKKYLYISPSCEKVLCLSQEDFYRGIDHRQRHIFEEDISRLVKAEELLVTEPFYELEYRIMDREGRVRWISEKSFAIRDDAGNYVRNSGISSDITEKKLTQTKLQQLSLAAEKTSNGILIADKDGNTIWANEGYLRMFEIPEKELIGKRPRDLFNADPEHFRTISRLNASNYTLEFEVTTYKGKKKWVELNCTAVEGIQGEVVQQVEVLTDITEKIKTRTELERYSLDLEFQNVLKEKLINAGSLKEITEQALGVIKAKYSDCIHISLLTLDEKQQNLEGYYLKGEAIEKESHPIKEIKSFEKIRNGGIFIESDLELSDEISVSDKILLDYGARSYAVIPIMEETGISGMITITFNTPYHLTNSDKNNLVNFSFILSSTIRQLNLKNSLQEKNSDINESLNYAQNIQRTILPAIKTEFPSLQNVSLIFKPKDIVSGDFYWAWETDDFIFVAIGDCTGHGVPGAFLTLIGSRILEQVVRIDGITSPAAILKRLDRQLFETLSHGEKEEISDGMEIAICAIDRTRKCLTFSGAGMGLLYFTGNSDYYIKGEMESIGDKRNEELVLHNHEVSLTDNQRFYMASDGYQDQLGGDNYRRFSRQKLMELLKEIKDKDAAEQENILNHTIEEYMKQHHQTDDMTLLGFTIKQ